MTDAPAGTSLDLDALRASFEAQDDVLFALPFGSHARGQAGALSVVDVAVLLDARLDSTEAFGRTIEVGADLSDPLQTNDVDVADLRAVSLPLKYRVYRDGVTRACRDRRAFVRVKAATMLEYLDFLPILERSNRTFIERAASGRLPRGPL
jgi:uncharacterized protein